ncbi:MAG TPA: GlsB/YeaQ/YmgE family stress response membrane protein [Ktedonobacterales bacterium]|nr:GlsB/YeaQ/YmgE family stress response membrane protein [Ktedonobacterales bacterium]
MLLAILVWIIIGGVAGWLASLLVRGAGLGIIGDIIVGIVGALIGGFIVSLLGGSGFTGFNLWSLIVAFIGAVILLFIAKLFARGTRAV